ncbi:uncharacterized protein LOC126376272 isoform X1 [Pectinophora gossypiella]|uniref:uncharacterized protein LOC126376272 isoform X1 n=1 Tax=Pectinophora gossypiella TaxID=13191 RepID=UPI00214E965C|nr:uncharacterized protein LOC126376272 isoform X1 [Pectinophora gossypiella]
MYRYAMVILLYAALAGAAKQQLQLSDSYLPVAMQVIAHLTDQMAFEIKDEPSPSKPTAKPIVKPTTKPTTKPSWTNKPANSWPTFTSKPTTSKPYVSLSDVEWTPPQNGWWMSIGLNRRSQTTPFHRPGLYAPVAPPKPSDRINPKSGFLLPFDHNTQYTVIEPQEKRTEEPLLAIHQEEVKPLMEPAKEAPLLPPAFEDQVSKRSDGYQAEELTEENLQYLSQNVKDLIKMAHDPDDERVVDVWEGVRANNQEVTPKGKLSSSNLRLLLLYDLLSREAKRQRLSDYSGFSPDVMRNLVESSSGGARAQLSLALSKMVERADCQHEYANNRAREMVTELAKDESKLSSELRYLQPLVYTN